MPVPITRKAYQERFGQDPYEPSGVSGPPKQEKATTAEAGTDSPSFKKMLKGLSDWGDQFAGKALSAYLGGGGQEAGYPSPPEYATVRSQGVLSPETMLALERGINVQKQAAFKDQMALAEAAEGRGQWGEEMGLARGRLGLAEQELAESISMRRARAMEPDLMHLGGGVVLDKRTGRTTTHPMPPEEVYRNVPPETTFGKVTPEGFEKIFTGPPRAGEEKEPRVPVTRTDPFTGQLKTYNPATEEWELAPGFETEPGEEGLTPEDRRREMATLKDLQSIARWAVGSSKYGEAIIQPDGTMTLKIHNPTEARKLYNKVLMEQKVWAVGDKLLSEYYLKQPPLPIPLAGVLEVPEDPTFLGKLRGLIDFGRPTKGKPAAKPQPATEPPKPSPTPSPPRKGPTTQREPDYVFRDGSMIPRGEKPPRKVKRRTGVDRYL